MSATRVQYHHEPPYNGTRVVEHGPAGDRARWADEDREGYGRASWDRYPWWASDSHRETSEKRGKARRVVRCGQIWKLKGMGRICVEVADGDGFRGTLGESGEWIAFDEDALEGAKFESGPDSALEEVNWIVRGELDKGAPDGCEEDRWTWIVRGAEKAALKSGVDDERVGKELSKMLATVRKVAPLFTRKL